ncbi:MAG: RdgB/HAM1 family non-canonical purine NTP pyrophosphatase [Burkholderiaceae bacterium]|nr:RdgB/HAM1 family non-canonical purine NTP pyrophosphatase [Burkholderiaceae bacterium]
MTALRIVIASNNPGKLRELTALLSDSAYQIVPQQELGVEAAAEPHSTFVENALAKARHAAVATGLPALADDSGLCVDVLHGAPGVLSARFAGEPGDDERNNLELLRRLAGATNRRAHYTCVLVALRFSDDAEPVIVEARWHGEIVTDMRAMRGNGGFGYDPLFYLAQLAKTAAELDSECKNRISHRGVALAAMKSKLARWL